MWQLDDLHKLQRSGLFWYFPSLEICDAHLTGGELHNKGSFVVTVMRNESVQRTDVSEEHLFLPQC